MLQWFARHSSSATWGCIKESWGECPGRALTEAFSSVGGIGGARVIVNDGV